MAIGTDFSIAANGDIRYTGAAHGATGAGYYTVIVFLRWLLDLADDETFVGDDIMDRTKPIPADRTTDNIINLINGYNIDDVAAEHLYNGSVIQAGGATIYDGLLIDANPDMNLQIIQNGARLINDFWNSIPFGTGLIGLNPDTPNGLSHRFMLKVRTAGADIDGRRLVCKTNVFGKSYSERKVNGTVRGNTTVPMTYVTDLNNTTASATVATWTTITNTQGYRSIDVDNNGTPENYYSEWNKDTFTINQLYERTKYLTRRGTTDTLYGLNGELFRGITHEINTDTIGTLATTAASGTGATATLTFAAQPLAIPTGTTIVVAGVTPTGYNGTFTVTASTTTTVSYANTTTGAQTVAGTVLPAFAAFEAVSWTGGTGQMLAINSVTAPTKMWIQLLTGVIPTDNQTITGASTATCLVNVTVTERVVSAPFLGVSTGTAIIGGYGVGIEALDLSATDKVFDLTNAARQAPNNVTYTVNNLAVGDAVVVAPSTGTVIDVAQMTLLGALVGAAVTAVVVNGTIPTDTPATGKIRILRASGKYTLHPYSAWSVSTFTITSHNFSTDNAANGANTYVAYLDFIATGTSASFTSVFAASRTLFIDVRHSSVSPLIKAFQLATATLGSAGGSTTVSRISDE